MSYLNSLRVKEFCGARDNLYHHFDRNTSVPQECKAAAASEDLTRSSRYAALNLAIMHALFGNKYVLVPYLSINVLLSWNIKGTDCISTVQTQQI